MGRIISHGDLEAFLDESKENTNGCFVDTNILFAADYELHSFNGDAVEIGQTLGSYKIPIFSNSIIRSELIELKRRVLITESLIDFYHLGGRDIPSHLYQKLRAHRDKVVEHERKDTHYFLTDQQIKEFRESFTKNISDDAWQAFCQKFLGSKIESEWNNQVASKSVHYIDGSPSEFLAKPVEWDKMTLLIERYGIGSSDAMIINFFLSTKFTFIVTADADVAYCMSNVTTDKACIIPEGLSF